MGAFLFNGSQIMRLDSVLNGLGRPVAYYPALARTFGGVKRSLWLCQFAYWKDKQKDPTGWIHKTEDAILKETGLSRHEQKSVKKWLLENDLCEIDKRGNPAKNHYLHDWEKITQLWNKHRTSQPESGSLEGTKTDDKSGGNGLTISTETTSETTTKKKILSPFPHPEFSGALERWEKLTGQEKTPTRSLQKLYFGCIAVYGQEKVETALLSYGQSKWHKDNQAWILEKLLASKSGEVDKFVLEYKNRGSDIRRRSQSTDETLNRYDRKRPEGKEAEKVTSSFKNLGKAGASLEDQ